MTLKRLKPTLDPNIVSSLLEMDMVRNYLSDSTLSEEELRVDAERFLEKVGSVLAAYYQDYVDNSFGAANYQPFPDRPSGTLTSTSLDDRTEIFLSRITPDDKEASLRQLDDNDSLELRLPRGIPLTSLIEGIENNGLGLRDNNFRATYGGNAERIIRMIFSNFGHNWGTSRSLVFVHSGLVDLPDEYCDSVDPSVLGDYQNITEQGWLPVVVDSTSEHPSSKITEASLYRAIGGPQTQKAEKIKHPNMVKFVIDQIPAKELTQTGVEGAIMDHNTLFFADFTNGSYVYGQEQMSGETSYTTVRVPLTRNFAVFEEQPVIPTSEPDGLNRVFNRLAKFATGVYVLSRLEQKH